MGLAAPVVGAVAAGIGAASSVASTIYGMSKGKPTNPNIGIGLENSIQGLGNLPIFNSPAPDLGQDYNLGNLADQFKQQQNPALLASLAPEQFSISPNLGPAPSSFNTPNMEFSRFRTPTFTGPGFNITSSGGAL